MGPTMSEVGQEMVERVKKHGTQNIPSSFIQEWTMVINVRTIFGDSLDARHVLRLFDTFLKVLITWINYTLLLGDWVVNLPFLPAEYTRRKVRQQLRAYVLEDIQQRRKFPSTASDLISLMLSSEDHFTDEAILDEAITFLFAGYDTTSITLVLYFTIHLFLALGFVFPRQTS